MGRSSPALRAAAAATIEPEPSAETEAPKKPGLSRAFVLPSNDPMSYTNTHAHRGKAVKLAIERQEAQLAASRSGLLSTSKEEPGDVKQVFRWDHVPIGFAMSDYQVEYFPRSIHSNRVCGGGKDTRFTRPFQDYERWREAVWQQENAMGKSK